MNKIKINIIIAFLMVSNLANGQKTTLFMGGIAHLGNGEKINNSIISIKDGKIYLKYVLILAHLIQYIKCMASIYIQVLLFQILH